jgi:hypothetical protein
MGGLPHDAFDVLARTMARICEDPYDRLFSLAVRHEDPRERMAEPGDAGFIQFTVDESAGLVRVYDLVWIGRRRIARAFCPRTAVRVATTAEPLVRE